jgi:lipid-A-disaccharide synthase-like uncharacterized protein
MEIYGFRVDFWTIWGFFAQFVFFLSFAVQWYKSEKLKQSHLPLEFWQLRILGSLMLIIYVLERRDIVFLTALVLQIVIYIRNIHLMKERTK